MASKRENIILESSESSFRYVTSKNKSKTPNRKELKKYDPIKRRHVVFKEKK